MRQALIDKFDEDLAAMSRSFAVVSQILTKLRKRSCKTVDSRLVAGYTCTQRRQGP